MDSVAFFFSTIIFDEIACKISQKIDVKLSKTLSYLIGEVPFQPRTVIYLSLNS